MLQKRLLTLSVLAVLLVPVAPVLAHSSAESGDDTTTTETEHSATDDNHTPGSHLAEAQHRLQTAKLKACQNREKAINTRLQNIANRGDRQLKVFDTIATRVEKFADDKNAKPANYNDLTSQIDSQKAAAQAAVEKIKAESVSFKCDGTDPKGALQTFKTDLKAEISALKSYRTSVKNLIVGVKTALNTTEGASHDETQ